MSDINLELAESKEEIKRLKSYIHNWYTPEIERLRFALNEAADSLEQSYLFNDDPLPETLIEAERYRKIARGEKVDNS